MCWVFFDPIQICLDFLDSLDPHRSFSDYYLLSDDFVVEQKIILLIINYLVILWSQSKIIDYMDKKPIKIFFSIILEL